jgi:translocation and assembly module TamB
VRAGLSLPAGQHALRQTRTGSDLLLGRARPRIDAAIAGDLGVGRIRASLRRLVLEGVSLRDPGGQVVAEVDRIEIRFSPLALARGRLEIALLKLDGPRLWLRSDERGLNLTRALAAPRRPPGSEATSDARSGRLRLEVQRLALARGQLELRLLDPGGERRWRLEDLNAAGSGSYDLATALADGDIDLGGRQTVPYQAPLQMHVGGQFRGAAGSARLDLELGGSRLAATLRGLDERGRRQELAVERFRLDPILLRALTPDVPVVGDITVRGELRRAARAIEADLGVELAGGALSIEGRFDLDRLTSPGLRVQGRNLNLAALLGRAPRSDLAFTLRAQGGGASLDTLEGGLLLEVSRSTLAGRALGPVRLELDAGGGRFELRELSATVPGASLSARGQATRRRLAVTATVRADSLGETMRALAPGSPPALFGGRGRLSAEIGGVWDRPTLKARGRFGRLRVQGHSARNLSLRVRVPDLGRPWLASGRIAADSARVAERQLERLGLALRTSDGRGFSARLSMNDPQPFELSAAGRWTEDRQALALARLRVSYPGTDWHLLGPSRVSFGQVLAVHGLRLKSGGQTISLDVRQSPEHLDARAVLRGLALHRLPSIARPPGVALAGWLDASLRAQGPPGNLSVTARGSLSRGRVGGLRGVALDLDGRLARGRLSGRIAGRAAPGAIRAEFDLPASYPPPPRAALDLDVEAPALDLAALLAATGQRQLALAGRARLDVRLSGTAATPSLEARAAVQDLTKGQRPIGDLALTVTAGPGRDLVAEAELTALGRPGRARVQVPLSLGRLLRNRPTADELSRLPFQANAALDEVPLASLARLAGQERQIGGTASLDLAVSGPAHTPTGSLEVVLAGARAAGLPPTDARLLLAAQDSGEGLTGKLVVTRAERVLATAEGRLALPSARLGDRLALSRAPLTLEAVLGPIRLQRLVAPAHASRGRPRSLRGRLDGQLSVQGSLGQPRLALEATVRDATLDGARLGHARMEVHYDKQRPRLELRLDGDDGGHVRLRAESQLDLGYQVVTAGGIDPWRLPVTATLEAHRYDLAPLSCLSDTVRVVEGRLSARADLRGSLASPRQQGRLEWRDGRLMVAGAGGYRRSHLLAHGDESRMVLDELTAHSGGGSARLTATADRRPGDLFALEARAELRRFPIHADGRRLASISMAPVVSGNLGAARTDLRARIGEAHVELASGQRGELQSLRRPHDVVLYWGEAPLNRTQARKHEALADARRALLTDRPPPTANAGRDADPAAAPAPPLVRLQVQAPNNLWVRGGDVNIELGLGTDFVVLARPEPAVFGTVFVRRGQVEVIGRRFRLDRSSTLRFNGPPAEPVLQIRAVHQPRHADNMTVAVTVSGPPDNLDLEVSSPEHPEYAQADLLTVVATGRPPDEGGDVSTVPSAQAASLLGGFLADRLQRTLMRRLPIDVLNIDPGDGLRSTQLEAGTYLGDDLYVAYVGRLGGEDPFLRENQNELQLEYRLSQRWSFEAVYGDARRGSADIVWTRRY